MAKEIIEGYRFSPQQRHLWSLRQADGGAAYVAQCAVLIEGRLEQATLREALEKVVARNEILRAEFRQLEAWATPVQIISDASAAWGQEQDFSSLDDSAREEQLSELLRRAAQTHSGSEQGSTLLASLVKWSPESHLLLVTLPALCADVPGLKHLVRELGLCYEACLLGQEVEGAPVQYADLAEWLNELQESAETEAGREYWRDKDISALPALSLPFEQTEGAGNAFETRQLTLKMGDELRAGMEALAESYNVSLSELALTCWQVLLWRLTGQTQVVVGVGSEGRSYEGLEESVGLLAKYLPLNSYLEEGVQFGAALARVHQSLSEIYEWEEYFSWEHLGKASAGGAGLTFFPFSFDFEEAADKIAAGGATFSLYRADACIERYKVKLTCVAQDGQLLTAFNYDSRRFTRDSIRRLAEQFHRLARSVTNDPAAAVGALDILGEDEERLLLYQFNDAEAAPLKTGHICQLIEQRAEQTPDHPAIICGEEQLSYAELNLRANRLARHLRELGAGPGRLVAICVERSPDMAVGILGILKAGAAYVPLDPAYPKDRLAFMMSDTRVPLLLTQTHLQSRLPEHAARVVLFDSDWPSISQQSGENPSDYEPAGFAYVIYTSGTTGEPRGAIITHDNLNHYAHAIAGAVGLTSDDRYLHTASIGFSSSVRQLLVPLAHGAAVVIATAEHKLDPLTLFDLVKRSRATIIDLVPSHWRACTHGLGLLPPERRAVLLDNDLRLILSASEALTSDVPRTWRVDFKHGARLVNMFGQTETTGIVTVHPIGERFDERVKGVPIGKPILRTRVYLLDERMRPAPLGVDGELYIGGEGVGEGYLNRPELTAERFVPDPFATQPGRRLYRTGDAARYRPDGTIEFRNRIDYQVKIRGFRVELGEVEAVLGSHLAISEAVVVAHDDVAGDKRLAAYIVPKQMPAPSVDGLQSFLREKLPEYMIPSVFVVLEALPLTANGKLDRSALPAPEQAQAASECGYVAPRTPVEETLTEIWEQVLGLEKVGVHDHFFRLGGHSLLATVLVSRVRDAFRIDLPVVSLFKSPTVSGLAEEIEQSLIGQIDTEVLAGLLRETDELSDKEIRARLAAEADG